MLPKLKLLSTARLPVIIQTAIKSGGLKMSLFSSPVSHFSKIRQELICPKSIVVIGGSEHIDKPGGKILSNILQSGFANNRLFVINPRAIKENKTTIQGLKCLNPEQKADQFNIDLAILLVTPEATKRSMEMLIEKYNVKAFIIPAAGFGETGSKGKKLEEEIAKIINKHKLSLIGPNCIGMLTPHYNGTFVNIFGTSKTEGCDIVSNSGAVSVFLTDQGNNHGIKFSSIFSVGNGAQIGIEDVLQYWDESFDPNSSSKIKLIYMEKIQNPGLLLKHATSLINKGCKIVAIKSGVSDAGVRALASHTGALVSSNEMINALFKKAGIIRCDSREELIATAAVLSNKELKGKNFAIVTNAGGPGVIVSDFLATAGNIPQLGDQELAQLKSKLNEGSSVENPIDILPTSTPAQVEYSIDAMEKNPGIDATILIWGDPGLQKDSSSYYQAIYRKTQECTKPIYVVFPSTPTDKVNDFKSLCGIHFTDEGILGKALVNILTTPKPSINFEKTSPQVNKTQIRSIINQSNDGYLTLSQIQVLLDAVGIPRAQAKITNNKDEVANLVEKLGYPIVMKVVGPIHKTDVGGVKLNIKEISSAHKAFDELMNIAGAEAVIVQHMALANPKALELFLGVKHDPVFGHAIVFGIGGIFLEVTRDISQRLLLIDLDEAQDMIHSLKGYPLIRGIRGQPGVNEKTLAEIIVKLSALINAAPEIRELDINPLMGLKDEIVAVDARIRVEKH